jgi:hypothetical protein
MSFSVLRDSVLPRPKFLFSCANLGHWPDACGKSELLCPRFSAGERSPKYQSSGFGSNHEPAVRIDPILFFLLRGSVPPWCKGLVFGCGFVALRFQVDGFDFAKRTLESGSRAAASLIISRHAS